MACNITITSVNLYGSTGQPISSVEVKGTATECSGNEVVVGISCGGTQKTNAVLATQGFWQATFNDLGGTGCICGSGFMRVTAFCKGDPNCPPASMSLSSPQCQSPCPVADDIDVGVDDCDAQGRRIVSLHISLPGSGSTNVSVDWQDNTPLDIYNPIPVGNTVYHHYLPPGPYNPTVYITGCPKITKPVGPLPPCNGGNGNGNGHHPCPLWWPFCKGWSLCAALLALAEASILTAFVLFFIAGCIVLTPDVLAGGYTAIVHALLAAAVFNNALIAAAAGLIFLTLWYLICSKFKADFCDTLYSIIIALAWFIAVQAALTVYLVIAQDWGCLIGLAMTFVYYGTVLAYLNLIRQWAGCPH